jgi:hypothetical protein
LRKLFIGILALAGFTFTGVALAQITGGVPNAQPAVGTQPNVLANGFTEDVVAKGSDLLENPQPQHTTYGYLDDNANPNLRTRTEPDENTYLHTEDNPGGPTPGYDYGRHFLIQGHENGGNKAYFTRVNLDVTDPAHRITQLSRAANGTTDDFDGNAVADPAGFTNLSAMDGSVYDPFTDSLLFTSENGANGRVVQEPFHWNSTAIPLAPSTIDDLDGSIGRAGYEGVVPDDLGNIYLAEDVGGGNVTDNGAATTVRQPNSFVYRFVPNSSDDLTSGKLQVLQISDAGTPITFHDGAVDPNAATGDALGGPIADLHSGTTLDAKWVTIHDTSVDGSASFSANALAKNPLATHSGNKGTPLKRPENGKFVPGTNFASFVFTETGDTDKPAGNYVSPAGSPFAGAKASARGSWGAVMRLDMPRAGSDIASINTVELGDESHASPDNLSFLDKNTVLVAEDRGNGLHSQDNTLDSIWSFDLTRNYNQINGNAQRLVALGRDSEALLFQNEDNEPTGIIVANGSTFADDILGQNDPATQEGVRTFYTQQHGLNITYEITRPGYASSESGDPSGPSTTTGKAGPGPSASQPAGASAACRKAKAKRKHLSKRKTKSISKKCKQ